ncbi:carbohydrate ABC transporter permease [Lachnospiraceae bacterium ZAX-1]
MKKRIKHIVSIFMMALMTVLVVGPLYWLIVTSLKNESEIYRIPPTLVPADLTVENYEYTLTQTGIMKYFLNSVIYVAITLFIVLVCVSLAAFAMSRYRFFGKRGYLVTILLSQLMPLTTLIVPLYVSMGKMHLLNTRFSIIAIYVAIQIPIALWLLIGYFNSIPREIDEAAIIDGCSQIQVLTRIVIPLAKPGLMAVSLTIVISVWQELMLAMTFNSKDALRPLMAGISASITKAGIKWGQMNATGFIALVPIIILYICFQKYLVKGLTGGAVKG